MCPIYECRVGDYCVYMVCLLGRSYIWVRSLAQEALVLCRM